MPTAKPSMLSVIILAVLSVPLTAAPALAVSGQMQVLHRFSGPDGQSPYYGNLISDAAGNLYGTTYQGGDQSCAYYGCGVVFELTPGANRRWTETILHSFKDDGQDGYAPAAGVVFDAAGNLYGTTTDGGAYKGGTVFKLAPGANGVWTETVLYDFCSAAYCADGRLPYAGLVLDRWGNLYGTTAWGGAGGYGTAFQLVHDQDGNWKEKVLYSFHDVYNGPYAGLTFDKAANLYGTTGDGTLCTMGGTVFKLTHTSMNGWTYTLLYTFSFQGIDGACPISSVTLDPAGNLYGTTILGGAYAAGTVFELAHDGQGGWTEKVLHSFGISDGAQPYADLIFDKAGNLYGTSAYGGANGLGNVFELMPNKRGGWTERVLHNFDGSDGIYPFTGLVFGTHENLFGATYDGGNLSDCYAAGCGVVFELTP